MPIFAGMKAHRLLLPAIFLSLNLPAQKPTGRVQLPNGWSLTPAGTSLPLSSDLPLNIALSPDGTHAAVTNNGNGAQTIDLINLHSRRLTCSVPIGKAWLGLAFGKKGLYASGGNDNCIIRYTLDGDTLLIHDTLVLGQPWPKEKISPTGLAVDEARQRLYVVTKEDNSLYVLDLKTKTLITKLPLHAEAYTCLLSPAKPELYISSWGGRKVWIYNTGQEKLQDSVTTGDHPTDMALGPKARTLFVANANSNSVSVIDLAARTVVETLQTAIAPDAPIGSTTNRQV
jgi:YVTN family beta-propeller protein